jgi:hypothetical protein
VTGQGEHLPDKAIAEVPSGPHAFGKTARGHFLSLGIGRRRIRDKL